MSSFALALQPLVRARTIDERVKSGARLLVVTLVLLCGTEFLLARLVLEAVALSHVPATLLVSLLSGAAFAAVGASAPFLFVAVCRLADGIAGTPAA